MPIQMDDRMWAADPRSYENCVASGGAVNGSRRPRTAAFWWRPAVPFRREMNAVRLQIAAQGAIPPHRNDPDARPRSRALIAASSAAWSPCPFRRAFDPPPYSSSSTILVPSGTAESSRASMPALVSPDMPALATCTRRPFAVEHAFELRRPCVGAGDPRPATLLAPMATIWALAVSARPGRLAREQRKEQEEFFRERITLGRNHVRASAIGKTGEAI